MDYSYAGNLFNLGTFKTDNDTLSKRLSRFKKLKRFFKEEDFDFIIDTRSRGSAIKELFYLHYLYKKQHIIYLAHSFNTPQYFTKRFWIGKKMVDKAVAIVGVSKAITRKIKECTHQPRDSNKKRRIYGFPQSGTLFRAKSTFT